MKNKILLGIADGVGDRPCQGLGYMTPLEYADTPHLDRLAAGGSAGLMDLHAPGTPVGTDLGHMILFGYSLKDYPGRGPIEAFGEGLELQPGDVALRCNLATVGEDMLVLDRRAGRIREGAEKLAEALHGMRVEDVQILFREATEHRAILVLRGEGLSAAISDTDPKDVGRRVKECLPLDSSPQALRTADILNRVIKRAHEILRNHPVNEAREREGRKPANCILTRGAGCMPELEKTAEKMGFRGACVAAESTVLGVARLAGFTPITSPSFTGNMDTDIREKARMAVEALKENDFVALHFKATDLMGHDDDPVGKAEAIRLFDQMMGMAVEGIEKEGIEGVIVALAADHSTPCERREHSGDPVPVVISGRNIRKDGVTAYNETACATGGIGRIRGRDMINTLLDYLEVTPKEGN